jgi:hypothetical protein
MSDPKKIKFPMAFDFPVKLLKPSETSQRWSPPENATKGAWYVTLYFSDKTPYVLKYDGKFWRTADDKLASVPMHIMQIPPPPPMKKSEKDSD